jgi:spore coat polysaccharide biosynthesis protein SpsF (cytidylyltransferase family)
LELLGGRPILERCLDRLRIGAAAPVVLATTTKGEDDALEAIGQRHGFPVLRGPDADVLGRFVLAAKRFDATCIVRATADNPAVDIDGPRRMLEALDASGADYVVETGLPHGTCVEAIAVDALRAAHARVTSAEDREHVTLIFRRDRFFHMHDVAAPRHLRYPHLRLTVDTREDLTFMRRVMSALGDPPVEPALDAIIHAATSLAAIPAALAS